MADAQTTNYGFTLPEVDGSDDTWGDKLNQNWVDVDTQLNTLAGRTIAVGAGLTGGGDLSTDRTIALGTPGTITAASTNAATTSSHTHEIVLSAADVGAPPATRILTAGNGLTGGGDLNADRTLTLGTPGTLSGGTTNSVTATSHTHSINSTALRTSPSTTSLLQAKGMNDHRLSGDHDGRYYTQSQADGRYYTQSQVDDRKETVNVTNYGIVTRTKQYKVLYFQVPKTVSQTLSATGKVQFTTDTGLANNGTTVWYFPSAWWDIANHRFIAPVDGLYHFYAQVYRNAVSGSNVAVNVHFRIDGVNVSGPQGFGPGPGDYVDGDNTYTHGRLDMTVYLTAGRYVEVWQSGGTVSILGSTSEKATYFGGFLL